MLTIAIPGRPELLIEHLLLDLNGTIAVDGSIASSVTARLHRLSGTLRLHVITADTHGTAADKLNGLPVELKIIGADDQDVKKQEIVAGYGAERCVAIGNGRNDGLMLEAAAVGIGVIGTEGAAATAIRRADILCLSIEDALDLLLKPDRLRATLRN